MTIAFRPFVCTVRYKLETVRRLASETASVRRNEGLLSSARHLAAIATRLLRWYHPGRVWRRHRTSEFDRRFGVDTSGFLHPGQFAAVADESADPHHYKAIRPEDFHAAISLLTIRHEDFDFVDYGSGKGRALLLASDYPFRRITGIEFSPELHQTALRNTARFRNPIQRCFDIRSVCTDAATFEPPEVPCVLFFYDPFGARLMSKALDQIGASLDRSPRELFIVYCQPRLRQLMSQRRFLELVVEGEHSAIFKAARRGEHREMANAGETLPARGHRYSAPSQSQPSGNGFPLSFTACGAVSHFDPAAANCWRKRSLRKISIIVPCRNEARYIAGFLASVAAQQFDGFEWEVIIADGMSNDGTREIIDRFREIHPCFRVIENPSRAVPSGLNAAIWQARGEIILRMDVHAEYRPDYVRECVAVLDETGAANVGGAHRPFAGGFGERVFAAAFQSPFAVGGALSHNCHYEGPVDTVIFGCWRKKTLEQIGCFDAGLVRNQDDELNFRIVRSGQKVWQSKRIISWYHPRTSVRQLLQQYFQYGYWKVPVILKHGAPASWRHLVPGAFVASLIALIAAISLGAALGLGDLAAGASALLGAVLGLYLFACTGAAAHSALSHGWTVAPFLPALFAVYHFGYGCGFLLGVKAHLRGRPPAGATRPVFTALTR